MTSEIKRERPVAWLLPLAAATLLAVGTGQARAMSVTLCAEPYSVNLPGEPTAVPMWGYRQVTDASLCSATSTLRSSAAAPVITMPAGDSRLAVTLVNLLPVPTSVVIAGQPLPADGGAAVMSEEVFGTTTCDPATMAMPARMACRVRSFTGETESGATRTYTFDGVRPGSFLLQSGTHPQVQVQMGLFALLRQDAGPLDLTARRLYVAPASDVNASFDVDATAVLSEVDAAQHARIAATLGTPGSQAQWKAGGNSTLDYAPRHFLINGRPFDGTNVAASDIGLTAPGGSRGVLRLANAGLQSRALMLTNGTWRLLTEDGYPYAAPREQASVLLPAGKTGDVAVITPAAGAVGASTPIGALFDRRGGAGAGQVARLVATNAAALNRAPVVNAGPDQSLSFPTNTTTVTGTAQDDGLPGPLTVGWSASGPGAATFTNATALSTSVSFATSGRYVVRLSASDGEFTTVDEAIVNVSPATADVNVSLTDGATSATTGSTVTYAISVGNNGPQAVNGATVTGTIPAVLGNVTWTCAPAAACVAASGSGNNLSAAVNLAAGGSATITLSGQLAASARGTLSTSVAVAVPGGYIDTVTNNNAATDTDTIVVAKPALAVLDNFDRANANTLGSGWQQLAVPILGASLRVNNNQASAATAGNAYWSTSLGAQQAAAFTFANTTQNNASLILKAGGNFTALGYYTSGIRVRYVGTGTPRVIAESTNNGIAFTEVANFPAGFAVGDTLTAMVDATGTVYVWKTTAANVTTALGSTLVSGATGAGRAGLFLPAGARVDNFSGGTVP